MLKPMRRDGAFMGVAASQFFSANNSDKQTLSKRIAPTAEQMEDQSERWEALAEHLRSDLNNETGYPIQHWLQGSYKFGTQIRPARTRLEFDIDLGIYYCWSGSPKGRKFPPKQLKSFVQASLIKYAAENPDEVIEVTPPKKRCCRIRYKGHFHIDVPVYHLEADLDARTLATEDDQWEISDPKKLYEWFKDSLEEAVRAKARRHIRYLKVWAALKFPDDARRPSSVLLTVLVAEAIKELKEGALASDDDALRALIDSIVARLDKSPDVPNPVNARELLSARLQGAAFADFLAILKHLQNLAIDATRTTDVIVASDLWTGAFEHFFPAPDTEELTAAFTERSKSKNIALIAFDPIVSVFAQAKNNPNAKFQGTNAIGPIPKGCAIRFVVANARDLPNGAEVHWIVRNEGLEAEIVNDLGHTAGTGVTREEDTAYNGTHHMDCMIKLRGQIIGFRRIPVTVQGAAVPPRNPLKRPSHFYPRKR